MAARVTYGIQSVRKALARGGVERLFLQEGLGPERLGRLSEAIAGSGVPVAYVAAAELQQLTGTTKHQGVAAFVQSRGALSEREAQSFLDAVELPVVLVLDGIADPRNFGALLRTADAAGVDLVVTGRSRNVGVTPVVSKVACGAAEAQPIAEVGNIARFLGHLADRGLRIVGTDDAAAVSLYEVDLAVPLALVVGAEGEGMRRLTREHCDMLVRLPMRGVVESLNVAVAAGICLYECVRQRSHLAPPGTLR